jgi:hypothetical protein
MSAQSAAESSRPWDRHTQWRASPADEVLHPLNQGRRKLVW